MKAGGNSARGKRIYLRNGEEMNSPVMALERARFFLARVACLAIAALFLAPVSWTQQDSKGKAAEKSAKEEKAEKSDKEEFTRLRVEVVAGEKEEPVDSASVYVRFVHERTLAKDERVEMNGKTNRNGVAILPNVRRGKVAIQVIAPGWKTFGQWYEIDKPEQTIRIKLQKPPRWY